MWQTKCASAVPKNLGLGLNFWPCSEGFFLSGCPQSMHQSIPTFLILQTTDYGRPERRQPSLHSQKLNPNPKFLGTAEACFVCHIGPIFQISLIYDFIGCPQSVNLSTKHKFWRFFSNHVVFSKNIKSIKQFFSDISE